jgi:hypothetical protein
MVYISGIWGMGAYSTLKKIAIVIFLAVGFVLPACSSPVSQGGLQPITSAAMVKLTQEELVAGADWIMVGMVTDSKSQWNDDRTRIYTLVTLSVEEWLKGQSGGKKIVIKIPGGEVNGITQQTEDVASLKIGEKVLVFLKLNNDGTTTVFGGFQGKRTIEGDGVVGSKLSVKELVSQIKAEVAKSSK